MLHRVEAIVIRAQDYGEGNAILTLFTRPYGKVSVMARGAKKAKSRHSAITQLFTYGEFTYYKSGSMGTLNQGEIISAHHALREDLHKSAYSAYMAEMVNRMIGEQEANPFLFEQFRASLDALEEGKDTQIVTHFFEMKMLAYAGYSPELQVCVSCGGTVTELFLSISAGGLLCRKCRGHDAAAIGLTSGTHKLLRLAMEVDIRRLGNVEVKEHTKNQLKHCMNALMDTHVGVQWKSRAFLEQMHKYNL